MADKTFEILDGFVSRANSNIKDANFSVFEGDLTVRTGDVNVNNGSNSVFHIDTSAEKIELTGGTLLTGDKVSVGGRLRATEFVGNGALITNLDVANIPDLTDNFLSSQDADSYESGGILSIANNSTLQVTSGSIKLSDNQTLVFGNGGDAVLDFDSASSDFIFAANAITTRIVSEFIPSRSTTGEQIAIGSGSGVTGQGARGIAIGTDAGQSNQGLYAVALGWKSANSDQGNYSIAIGQDAGELNQNASCIAIGPQAASNAQGQYSIAIGRSAGDDRQGANSIAIGYFSGFDLQGNYSVSIGHNAARTNQNNYSIAIGYEAGETNQSNYGIGIGTFAGNSNQGAQGIAIGGLAAQVSQGLYGIAIGASAGQNSQGRDAIAIGYEAGGVSQNNYSIAIGSEAGNNNQRAGSIAIGRRAGKTNQGANSIHISSKATNDVITTNNHIWIASPEANLMYTSANSWLFETPTVANSGVYYNENYYDGGVFYRRDPSPDLTIYKYSSNTGYYGNQLKNDFLMLKSEHSTGNAELTFQHTGQYFKIYARQQTSDIPFNEGFMLSAATYGQSNTSVDASVFIDSFGGAVDLTGYTTIQKIDSDSYGKVLTVGNFTYSSANSTAPMHFSQFANVASYPGGGANVGSTRWVYENGVVGTPEAHSNWMWTEPGANLHIGTFLFYSNSNNYYNYKTAIKIVPNKLSNISVQPYPILQYAGSDRLKITYQGGTLYGTLTQTSALKYKENVRDITSGEVIDNLRPIIYDSKDGATINMPGLIADEVANSIPEIVTYDDEGNVDGLTYDRIIPHMIKKIQELSQEIEALKGNA